MCPQRGRLEGNQSLASPRLLGVAGDRGGGVLSPPAGVEGERGSALGSPPCPLYQNGVEFTLAVARQAGPGARGAFSRHQQGRTLIKDTLTA